MGIPVSEFGMHLHWLHVLGQVQEQGPADAVPDNSEGSPWALCARCCPDRVIPTRPGVETLILAVDIVRQGRGKGVWGGTDSHGRLMGGRGGGGKQQWGGGEERQRHRRYPMGRDREGNWGGVG